MFKGHASGRFQQALSEALPRVQAHLEQARTLARQLEAGGDIRIAPAAGHDPTKR